MSRGLFVSLCLVLAACSAPPSSVVFETRFGMGFDKWASIWLIKRHVSDQTEVRWIEDGEPAGRDAILFDEPESEFRRTLDRSAFASLGQRFAPTLEALPGMERLVHDIEVNYWAPPELPYSTIIEAQYRALQAKFGHEETPTDCYLAFFDRLAAALEQLDDTPEEVPSFLPDDTCAEGRSVSQSRPNLIAELPIEFVLAEINAGKVVRFIDVREPDEFAEGHIPTAVNWTIRQARAEPLTAIGAADLYIPYCVKDFRAFEMARVLQSQGLNTIALMQPYGYAGWVRTGLPVVTSKAQAAEAEQRLRACAQQPETCLSRS